MELKRSEWPSYQRELDRPSKDGCQEQSLNQLMLQETETSFVVNDESKTGTTIPVGVGIGAE